MPKEKIAEDKKKGKLMTFRPDKKVRVLMEEVCQRETRKMTEVIHIALMNYFEDGGYTEKRERPDPVWLQDAVKKRK